MAKLYFSLLPSDLILEEALYLNHSQTEIYCLLFDEIFCNNIWIYKIRKELKFTKFISTETVLPLSLKYLELKSLTRIDFGSEYFREPRILIERAVRVKDTNLRRQLVDYLFDLPNIKDEKITTYRFYMYILFTGLLAINDTELYEKYLNIYKRNDQQWAMAINYNLIATQAYAEAGNIEQAEIYRTSAYIDKFFIAVGLARGGHLQLLKPYIASLSFSDLIKILEQAAEFTQENVVNYLFNIFLEKVNQYYGQYPKSETYDFYNKLICNNNPDFTLSIIKRFVPERLDYLVESAAKAGLTSVMLEISTYNPEVLNTSLIDKQAYNYNHIDTLLYIKHNLSAVETIVDLPEVLINPLILILELDNKLVSLEILNKIWLYIKDADKNLISQIFNKY